ncbi:Polygalacturonase [Capsicum annuum]|nr:Polygalacturonase [Capsicum annuum]
MLTYRRFDHLDVVGYSDSDYVGCVDTRKSTFEYLFLLTEGAISWKSSKQSVIVASTMKAEFVTCFEATIPANRLQNFISGFGLVDNIARPLKIYSDNIAAVFFSKNGSIKCFQRGMQLNKIPSKIVIPKGTFFMNQVRLVGNCKAPNLELQIHGTLKAPPNPSQFKHDMAIKHIDHFTFCGGVLDGQGEQGIHVARSRGVNITNSQISTGDDCISIGDGVQQMYITTVTCGPGHGISVGSLGKTTGELPVVGVFVQNCTFIDTDNGVRVKTWPAHVGVCERFAF